MHRKYVSFISAVFMSFILLVQVSTALSAYDFKFLSLGKDHPSLTSSHKPSTETPITYYTLRHLFTRAECDPYNVSSLDSVSSNHVYSTPTKINSQRPQPEYDIRSTPHTMLPLLQVFRI